MTPITEAPVFIELACKGCGKHLHNELDTYGEWGNERCFDCWFNPPEDAPPVNRNEVNKAIAANEREIARLSSEIVGIEEDISELESERDELQAEMDTLQAEIEEYEQSLDAQAVKP